MTMKTKTKNIQLTARIDDRDMERKAAQAAKFATSGSGVSVTLRLRGRELQFKERAQQVLTKFLELTGAPSNKANPPKWNGMTLSTFIHPWEGG